MGRVQSRAPRLSALDFPATVMATFGGRRVEEVFDHHVLRGRERIRSSDTAPCSGCDGAPV